MTTPDMEFSDEPFAPGPRFDEEKAKEAGYELPPIPVPEALSGNWPDGDRPSHWIEWDSWRKRRGAIWWQVVELSLGYRPGMRCVKDMGWGYAEMVSGKIYDLSHPNPIRERLEITQQYQDKLKSMPAQDSPRFGPCTDPYLPGQGGLDWAIEWGRFREFALSRGWLLPAEFPVNMPFEPSLPAEHPLDKSFEPSNSSEREPRILAGSDLPNRPKDWGATDAERLEVVRKAGLDSWVVEVLVIGLKKEAIVADLLRKLGEPPDKLGRYRRVVQALTPKDVAAKEKHRGGSGR